MKGFLFGVCVSAVIVAAVFFFLQKETNIADQDIEFDPIVVIRDTIRIEKSVNIYVESESTATIQIIDGIGSHVFHDSIPFFFTDTTKVGIIESRGFVSVHDSINIFADSVMQSYKDMEMLVTLQRSMLAGIYQNIVVIAKPEIPISLRDLLSGSEGQALIKEYIRVHDEEIQKKPNIFIGCSASVPLGIGPGVSVMLGRWCIAGSATATQQGSCTFIGVGYRVW